MTSDHRLFGFDSHHDFYKLPWTDWSDGQATGSRGSEPIDEDQPFKMSNETGNGKIRLDPVIAVNDLGLSADWYCKVFGLNHPPGEDHFVVLRNSENEVVLCLHPWEKDNHPTMLDRSIPVGNGLLLYFRRQDWKVIKSNLERIGWQIEEEVHVNPNSRRQEFSFRDPDGYYITVTEFHNYEG